MSSVSKPLEATGPIEARNASSSWREIWLKEDWWAIWIGLGTVIVAYLFFANGSQHQMVGGDAGQMVGLIGTGYAFCRKLSSLYCAVSRLPRRIYVRADRART